MEEGFIHPSWCNISSINRYQIESFGPHDCYQNHTIPTASPKRIRMYLSNHVATLGSEYKRIQGHHEGKHVWVIVFVVVVVVLDGFRKFGCFCFTTS